MDLFVYKEEMRALMETVQVPHQNYTFVQVMQNLRKYVTARQLLSPSDPSLIVLGEDPLAGLLGSLTFDLKKTEDRHKLVQLMMRHLEPCRPNTALSSPAEESCRAQGIKRKISSTDFDEPVSGRSSPMYLEIPPSPAYDSGDETALSVQSYPTDEARDSGSSFESEDMAFQQSIPSCSAVFQNTQLRPVDSDVAFWADHSGNDWWSDLEPNPKLARTWNCVSRRKMLKSKGHRRMIKQRQEAAKLEKMRSFQESCTTEESKTQDQCIICVTRIVNSLILHGQTAHNVCCYICARKLQKQPNRCPICRMEIDRVVHFM